MYTYIFPQDNLPVIHLLSKKPVGILHLLDDESNFPMATDSSFLEKCHYNHALNELYSRPRLNVPEFGIRHFAGFVSYNVEGFLDKNRDTLRTDVVDLLISSSLPVSMIYSLSLPYRLVLTNTSLLFLFAPPSWSVKCSPHYVTRTRRPRR